MIDICHTRDTCQLFVLCVNSLRCQINWLFTGWFHEVREVSTRKIHLPRISGAINVQYMCALWRAGRARVNALANSVRLLYLCGWCDSLVLFWEMTIGIMHFLSISVILFISSNLMMDIWEKAKITKSIERARQVLIA